MIAKAAQKPLKLLKRLAPNNHFLLTEIGLELFSEFAPPSTIQFSHHNLENDDIFNLGLSMVLPMTFGWRTHIGGEATKMVNQRLSESAKELLRVGLALVIPCGQQKLNEMHSERPK